MKAVVVNVDCLVQPQSAKQFLSSGTTKLKCLSVLMLVSLFFSYTAEGLNTCENYFTKVADIQAEAVPATNNLFVKFWRLITLKHWRARMGAARKHSAQVIKDLNNEPMPEVKGRKNALTEEEREQLLIEVSRNPVTRFGRLHEYDPEGNVGYCFGRAMCAHLEALWGKKLANESIRKVFVLGKLGSWRYHVTTVVRGTDKKWYAIDPFMGRVMTIEDWHFSMRTGVATLSDVYLFASKSSRYFPGGSETYAKGDAAGNYEKYFEDLLDHYREKFRRRTRELSATRPPRGKITKKPIPDAARRPFVPNDN